MAFACVPSQISNCSAEAPGRLRETVRGAMGTLGKEADGVCKNSDQEAAPQKTDPRLAHEAMVDRGNLLVVLEAIAVSLVFMSDNSHI